MTEPSDIYDPAFVKDVFDRCSSKYILMSSVLSFGFIQMWRKACVKHLAKPQTDDTLCYDLMAGTGEVWPHLFKARPDIRQIKAIDFSSGMYDLAMERLHKMNAYKIGFEQADVLKSELTENSADMIISTFGLKTFSSEQLGKLAQLTARSLKSGGTFSMIETSDPKGWMFRPVYLFHLKTVLPMIEKLFLKGATDFRMIGTYSTNFGNAEDFAPQLRAEGLDVTFRKHFFGCATSVSGRKP